MSSEDNISENDVREDDAWRDDERRSQPGGMSSSGEQSEGGGDGYEDGRTHTGWGPADGELADAETAETDPDHRGRHRHTAQDAWRADARESQPGGTAASGEQSQGGGGGYENGRTHTGWGPVDGELAEEEA